MIKTLDIELNTQKYGTGVFPKFCSYGTLDSLTLLRGAYEVQLNGDKVKINYPKTFNTQIIESNGWRWKGSVEDGVRLQNPNIDIETHLFRTKHLIPELCDENGNVWVVEMGKGIHCFKPMKIINYSNGEELLDGSISAISARNNQLGVGYKSGYTQKIALESSDHSWLRKQSNYIVGLFWLGDDLYAQSSETLYKYNTSGKNESIKQYIEWEGLPGEILDNYEKRVLEYKPNILSMVGNYGVCLWNTHTKTIFLDSRKHRVFRLQDQLIDDQSNIWTTSEKGIYRFDTKSEELIPYVQNISVAGIVQLDNNDIWCSNAQGGLLLFVPSMKSVKQIDLGPLTNNTFIKHLRKDKNGIIWGTSNKGLFRIDPNTTKVDLIQKSDGLLSNLLTGISIDGTNLFVSSSKGVSLVNINEEFKSSFAPQLTIGTIRLNGTEASKKDLLNLKFNENNLEIKFKAIGFETPGVYNYRYRLKGLNDEWQYTTELKALFLSIPDGSYQFEVESFDPRGGWSVRQTLEVKISPPFWKTWWFIGGVTILNMMLLFFLYKRRIRKLEQTNRLKNEIRKFQQHAMTAQMNPHFIFNSMNSIQRFILENERLIANEYLVKFSGLMRLTLENSKKIWVPIEDEVQALKLYLELESLRFKNKLNWEIEITDDVDESLKIPTLLIQPFVENSIWHGLMPKKEGGQVTIRIGQKDDTVFCEVIDNGVGRKQAEKLKSEEHKTMESTGVSITEQRLELLHSKSSTTFKFSIEDRKDLEDKVAGTRVYFTIPTIE